MTEFVSCIAEYYKQCIEENKDFPETLIVRKFHKLIEENEEHHEVFTVNFVDKSFYSKVTDSFVGNYETVDMLDDEEFRRYCLKK